MYEDYNLTELEKLKELMIKNNLDTSLVDRIIEKRKNKSKKSSPDIKYLLKSVIRD
ncbi:MAG: hypothetical protein ACTSPY_00955 [Candidatus Helarchaeota archaeon]